jgi:hypothetical protein
MTTELRGRRTWIATYVLLLVVGFLGAYFGPQISTAFKLRRRFMSASAIPRGLDSTPQPLADTTASTAEGTTLSYYGYNFEVPWKEIVKVSDLGESEWVTIDFKDGQRVVFVSPGYFENREGKALERDADQSKYEQCKAVISMTPSQLTPFCSHRSFARALSLLDIKGGWFEHNAVAPDIFSFKTSAYRGFEISGLSRGWNSAKLVLFDPADHRFELTFSVIRSSNVNLNQSEINRAIQTLAPSPSTPALAPR